MYDGGELIPTSTGDGVIGLFENNVVKFECDSTACRWKEVNHDMEDMPSYAVVMRLPANYTCKK